MTNEPRAATVRANCDTVCLIFSRETFEDAISGSNALLGNDVNDNVDWSKDEATKSLYKHIEKILQIKKINCSHKTRRVLYELTTAFTPELSCDEIIARMVLTVRIALKGDRVGLFVVSEDRKSMILKVSERSKGIKLPIKGLAGNVIESNENLKIPDAYEDSRFDSSMDRRTGYRTRQVLGVPVRHPVSDEAIGVLQVNNRVNGSLDPFTEEEEEFLMLAAEQLSDLLHGRNELIADDDNQQKVDVGIVHTAEVATPFQVELFSFNFFNGEYVNPAFKYFEVRVSMHLALNELCTPRAVVVEIPSAGKNAKVPPGGEIVLDLKSRVVFNISTKDVPRAARILFRVSGSKKKKGPYMPVGWAAAPVFDFKGMVDTQVSVSLFEGDNDVPINTTLSNSRNTRAPSIAAVLCADIVLADSSNSAISVMHTMPTPPPFQAKVETFSPSDAREINRILLLSFNPMSQELLTSEDKDFLWSFRHKILEKPELLPAFLMCVQWQNAEHVSEVYEILELWEPPLPTQAMQLLDRRFMDPKVRAFAVHCLEELADDELQLYMLQLCQQIKFENYADSALSRFLLRRALKNMRLIGHIFFWQLQSEVFDVDVRDRFTILLQIYIRNCDDHRVELGHQMFVMKRLENVAETVKTGESKSERLSILKEQLRATVLPKEFQLPLNPHLKVKGIEVEDCKVMESKKKPLWLVMHNCDVEKPNVVLMLKVGDDLRQDILIMQLLRVMDDLWKKEGLDMQMMLYDCISTGFERGLLQVVLNATTVGRILSGKCLKHSAALICLISRHLAEVAYKKTKGKLSRKFGSALNAINDFDHLRDFILDEVCHFSCALSALRAFFFIYVTRSHTKLWVWMRVEL